MIVVDPSALLAIVLNEPERSWCEEMLNAADEVRLSAASRVEAFMVAHHRGVGQELEALIVEMEPVLAPVTATTAELACDAFLRWGKGRHPAGLNFSDCFAYALARELDCPLLFVGDDLARTDVRRP